jgi:hypothetical protein
MRCLKWVLGLGCLGLLCACATVDQFGSRLYDGNTNSQNALNQETLLNILRSARHQTPNFIGVSQITGGQTEVLSTGLPTINIGPHQTAAQQVYSISNNLTSTVNSTYQANPLLSTNFQEGMLFPVNFKQLALLIGSHPRELVFHLAIDSIIISRNGREYVYLNDPTYNNTKNDSTRGIEQSCSERLSSPNRWLAKEMFDDSQLCNYSKFVTWLQLYIDYGLTAELTANVTSTGEGTAPSPATNTVNTKSPTNQTGNTKVPESVGKLCFDRTLKVASLTHGTDLLNCSTESKTKSHVPFSSTLGYNYGVVTLERINLRSALGMFQYVAKAWGTTDQLYYTQDAVSLLNGPLVNIVNSSSPSCYSTATFEGVSWCIPEDAEKTAVVLDMLQDMRNFAIQPTDLNSAFTVHVTN